MRRVFVGEKDRRDSDDESSSGEAKAIPQVDVRESSKSFVILPVIQPENSGFSTTDATGSEPAERGDGPRVGDPGWIQPAWSSVLLIVAFACWLLSPRGFLVGRFLNDVFLWLAGVFFFLGITILVSDWLGPKQPAEGENLIGHDAGSSEEPDGEDVG